MKKLITVAIILSFAVLLCAGDIPVCKPVSKQSTQTISSIRDRDVVRTTPTWTFNAAPTSLLTSYYDYMIGSYNNLPMCLIPPAQGGGYYLTYQEQPTATGVRRVYYTHIDDNNTVQSNSEITTSGVREGYSSLDYDSATNQTLFAWHANNDADTQLEMQATWSSYLGGIPEFPAPMTAINNPTSITDENGVTTLDNEFIWSSVQIGPSPVTGMRRVYVMGRNDISHVSNTNPSENVYFAYADFNIDMINNEQPLTWFHNSIPLLNNWNNATDVTRRPFVSLCVGNDGKVFVVGYHTAVNIDDDTDVLENDLDVFINENYGAGTWERQTASSRIITGNPPTNFGNGPGFFIDENGDPYEDFDIFWQIMESGHMNSTIDSNGIIHMIGLWHLANAGNSYYPAFNVMKEMTFNTNTDNFAIREIYPKAGTSSDNLVWKPWDTNGDGIVDEYEPEFGDPIMVGDWNYSFWDDTIADSAMQFHYNNEKITEPNASGQMAAVWQNSYRARLANQGSGGIYAEVPEIYISVSPNYGEEWSDPIIINSVDVPSFSGNCPMWVYPADKIKSTGSIGKLGLMFYSDNSWGSYSLSGYGLNNGGIVKYMALDINFASLNPTVLAGTVTRSNNSQPIANATVTVGTLTATTDAFGYYSMILPGGGIYDISVTALGYNPQTLNDVTIVNFEVNTVDVSMVHIPTISATGTVTGGDPSIPLEGATVFLSGVINYTAITSATGTFTLSNVLSGQTYNYVISKPGYESANGSITVGGSNYQMGTIHLNELSLPPLNVTAILATDNNSVTISWSAPAVRTDNLSASRPGVIERNLTGYQIWRLHTGEENYESFWVSMAVLTAAELSYTDLTWSQIPLGNYRYAVKALYSAPSCSLPAFTETVVHVLANYDNELSNLKPTMNCYPNPFGTGTTLAVQLPKADNMIVKIYNVKGALVKTLCNGLQPSGTRNLFWDGTDIQGKTCSNGLYFARLTTGKHTLQVKLILVH